MSTPRTPSTPHSTPVVPGTPKDPAAEASLHGITRAHFAGAETDPNTTAKMSDYPSAAPAADAPLQQQQHMQHSEQTTTTTSTDSEQMVGSTTQPHPTKIENEHRVTIAVLSDLRAVLNNYTVAIKAAVQGVNSDPRTEKLLADARETASDSAAVAKELLLSTSDHLAQSLRDVSKTTSDKLHRLKTSSVGQPESPIEAINKNASSLSAPVRERLQRIQDMYEENAIPVLQGAYDTANQKSIDAKNKLVNTAETIFEDAKLTASQVVVEANLLAEVAKQHILGFGSSPSKHNIGEESADNATNSAMQGAEGRTALGSQPISGSTQTSKAQMELGDYAARSTDTSQPNTTSKDYASEGPFKTSSTSKMAGTSNMYDDKASGGLANSLRDLFKHTMEGAAAASLAIQSSIAEAEKKLSESYNRNTGADTTTSTDQTSRDIAAGGTTADSSVAAQTPGDFSSTDAASKNLSTKSIKSDGTASSSGITGYVMGAAGAAAGAAAGIATAATGRVKKLVSSGEQFDEVQPAINAVDDVDDTGLRETVLSIQEGERQRRMSDTSVRIHDKDHARTEALAYVKGMREHLGEAAQYPALGVPRKELIREYEEEERKDQIKLQSTKANGARKVAAIYTEEAPLFFSTHSLSIPSDAGSGNFQQQQPSAAFLGPKGGVIGDVKQPTGAPTSSGATNPTSQLQSGGDARGLGYASGERSGNNPTIPDRQMRDANMGGSLDPSLHSQQQQQQQQASGGSRFPAGAALGGAGAGGAAGGLSAAALGKKSSSPTSPTLRSPPLVGPDATDEAKALDKDLRKPKGGPDMSHTSGNRKLGSKDISAPVGGVSDTGTNADGGQRSGAYVGNTASPYSNSHLQSNTGKGHQHVRDGPLHHESGFNNNKSAAELGHQPHAVTSAGTLGTVGAVSAVGGSVDDATSGGGYTTSNTAGYPAGNTGGCSTSPSATSGGGYATTSALQHDDPRQGALQPDSGLTNNNKSAAELGHLPHAVTSAGTLGTVGAVSAVGGAVGGATSGSGYTTGNPGGYPASTNAAGGYAAGNAGGYSTSPSATSGGYSATSGQQRDPRQVRASNNTVNTGTSASSSSTGKENYGPGGTSGKKPSKLHGYFEKAVGTIQSGIGKVTKNEETVDKGWEKVNAADAEISQARIQRE